MEPRTKLEKRVVELSAKLRPITAKQQAWGIEKLMGKYAWRHRNTTYCLECGHSWKPDTSQLSDTLIGVDCPACGRQLKMKQNYSTNCSESRYFSVWQVVSGIQVIRTVIVKKFFRMSKPSETQASEVMQHWLDPNGKVTWLSKSVQGLSSYYDQWYFRSDMTVKRMVPYTGSENRFWIMADAIYPLRSVLPAIKRNGFKGSLHGFNPVFLLPLLLAEPHVETLMKAKQFSLIKEIKRSNEHWASVKICLRNGYMIKDAGIWFDYLNLLTYFGKDLRNAKYVCPADLKAAHDKLSDKKREVLEKEAIEKKRQRAQEQNEKFMELKAHLLGLRFDGEQITIKTLDSVQEYMEEGDTLHHCVFTNDYFLKDHSLCLSARIDEQPVETIEVDLEKMAIVQCRGLHNKKSEHHDNIMKLMSANLPKIAKIAHQTATV